MAEGKEEYFDPSKANMLKLKKEAKKNKKRPEWDVPNTTPRGAQSLGSLMKIALLRKFSKFAAKSAAADDSIDLLEAGAAEGKAAPERTIKEEHLLPLIKDCGETTMPPQQIKTTEDGAITWKAFLTWWQLGQQHLEDVYSEDED